jgi:antitoxin (DNA-binding transcriptional repressor) of toxin-antitoxin stability system
MKTLTIAEPRKNLGRWLAAADRGEDVGIVVGSSIIALRRVEVEPTDYAQREYGVGAQQVAALDAATERCYRRLKNRGALVTLSTAQLRKLIE